MNASIDRVLRPWWLVVIIFLCFDPAAGAAVPGAPTGLVTLAGNAEASITWDAVSGAATYAVYQGTAIAGPFRFIAQTQGVGFSIRGLVNAVTYHFIVAALNADGRGPDSAPVSVVPTAAVLAAPINLAAAAGKGQASLKWDAVGSAVNYNVYRASARGGPYTLLTPPAPGPSFTDTGLADATPYYYVVQTMSTNAGAYSDEVAVTPSAVLPAAPTGVLAGPGSTWSSLAWNPSAGATGYAVYRATATGGPFALIGHTQTTAFEDFGLVNGTTYHYTVAAVNAAGQGAFSTQVSAAVAANQKPHAPVLTAFKTGTQQIQLYWDSSAGAVSYTVYRSETAGGPYTSLGTQSTDTGLVNGTTYFYVVDAHNASPVAARSNEVAVMPVVVLPPPANVSVIAGNTEATVNWNPVAGATVYYISVYDAPGGTYVTGGSSGGPGFTAVGLTNGLTYYVTVQSGGGPASAPSAMVAVTPSASRPLAPAGLSAPAVGNTQVSLQWNPAADAEGYMVFRRPEGSPWSATPVATVTGTIYTDGGLVNGTRYYFKVASFNGAGAGAWTAFEAVVVPVATAQPSPTEVMVVPGNTQATVRWHPVAGGGDYHITVASSLGGYYTTGGWSDNAAFTATGLTNGITYYVRVQAMGAATSSAFSEEVAVTPDAGLPLAPESLGAANVGNTQVSLQWLPAPGAMGYQVFRQITGGAWPAAPLATIDGTLFTDTGLDNGVRYRYRVAALNTAGTGAWSQYAAPAMPVPTAPLAPTGVAVAAGNTEATVTWLPVVGASDYYVTVAATRGGNYMAGGYTGPQLCYRATGLTNGQPYYFRVQAMGDAASAASPEVTTEPSAALPLAPLGFAAAVVGNTQVSLQWNPVPGATGYRVYRRGADQDWGDATVAVAASPLFTDTGLVNGTSYIYGVAAENGSGTGARAGNEVVAVPTGSAPTAPANVVVVAGDGGASISWDAVAGATDYFVTVANAPGGGSVTGSGWSGLATSYQATGLANGQTYYFRVQATSGGLLSAFSAEAAATPQVPADHGTITGKVSVNFAGHSDLGVANATVYLQGTAYSASTDAGGFFSLANIPFADYVLVVSAPGMDPLAKDISLSGASLPVILPQLTITETSGVPGDADGDGRLGLSDALYVLQVLTAVWGRP